MKKALLFSISVLGIFCTKAQGIVSSSCAAPDSVIAKYKTDAQRIALSRIYKLQSPYVANAVIDKVTTDSFLNSIISVYNAIMPERDSVITKYNIHSRPYQAQDTNAYNLNTIEILADTSQQWVSDLKQNIFPTSNIAVNNLVTKYGLKLTYASPYSNYINLATDTNYNMAPIAYEWVQNVTGIYSANGHVGTAGDGNYILSTAVTATFRDLIFSYGAGDCPAGCTYRKNWLFRCYNDCGVEFINSWEGIPTPPAAIEDPSSEEKISVYPNPVTDNVDVLISGDKKLNNQNSFYIVYDITGKIVQTGNLNAVSFALACCCCTAPLRATINISALRSGMYILQLFTDRQSENIRLIKQ